MAVNKVTLLGYVGNNPKVHVFESGQKVVQLSLATSTPERTLENGTKVPERTEWHNIIMYNSLANVAEKYVKKGDKLYIEGEIRYRFYDDDKNVRHYVTEIYAQRMELLTSKPKDSTPPPPPPTQGPMAQQNNGAQQTKTAQSAPSPQQGQSDDLPF